MRQYYLNSTKYHSLTIVAGSTAQSGVIRIISNNSDQSSVKFEKYYNSQFQWYEIIEIEEDENYILEIGNIKITYMYLSGNDDVLENGICFLDIIDGSLRQIDISNIGDAYTQQYRNRYHFSPFKNWMNDPNGLCYFHNKYHVFYQMNPADIKWGSIYWGHAVSDDLLHWTHLPIALYPQHTLYSRDDLKGGAYTGSAIADDEKITLYFTRCETPFVRGKMTKEYQVEAFSDNGVDIYGERVIITDRPRRELDLNFRDPKAIYMEGNLNLLLAATYDGVCSVLRYKQDENGAWRFKDIVLQDKIDCNTYECINYIPSVDNSESAFICATQNVNDPYRRTRLTYYYIGELKDGKFNYIEKKLYDFGTSAYAMQTMELEDRTLIFGWIGSFYGEFKPEGSISNGCLTLPREVFIKEGKLHTIPSVEVEDLNDYVLKTSKNENIELILPHYCYRVDINFKENTDFYIILAENENEHIGLEFNSGRVRILNGKKNGLSHANLFEDVEYIHDLMIFVDYSVVEIFINSGTMVGTKDYFINHLNNKFIASFRDPAQVVSFKLTMLKATW